MTTNTQPQTQQSGGDELTQPLLSVDYSALDFFFDAVLPEVSEHTRRGMRAAIVRGVEARERTARVDEVHKAQRALERPPKSIDTGLMRISSIEHYFDGRIQQLQPKPQAGEGGE
jgi:hypothetical protein